MNPWLDDGDLRLYHGDALETVRQLPDESVDCVVTSPPYWGLRDYGTREWDGGDPDCDHRNESTRQKQGATSQRKGRKNLEAQRNSSFRQSNPYGFRGSGPAGPNETYVHQSGPVDNGTGERAPLYCGKCGARSVDRQMGLEPTPDLFVAGMVELFREIRRVLAPHGTCWVNLGDSYNSRLDGSHGGWNGSSPEPRTVDDRGPTNSWSGQMTGLAQKNLMGMPWRVAFGLQADGWILRSDIIWAKPNPMPESVTDRPTKAHEYVFLLTKSPRYWFDTEAVREPHQHDGRTVTTVQGQNGSIQHRDGERWPNAGRNVRSVWSIATQPYPEAHFATYPEELARRCILAGCPVRVCRVCGKPSERIVERGELVPTDDRNRKTFVQPKYAGGGDSDDAGSSLANNGFKSGHRYDLQTVGWSECDCSFPEPAGDDTVRSGQLPAGSESKWRPGLVLDPFIGSGTTAKVARDHQRHAIGIDLNETYLELAARRLQQLSLLNAP